MLSVNVAESKMSPRTRLKLADSHAVARNLSWPVEKLSYPTTTWPSDKSRSVKALPTNPAQPVTKHRNLLTFMVMRMDNGQKSAAGSIVHHFARTQSDCEWESIAVEASR